MIHNIAVVDEKEYQAVKDKSDEGCNKCAITGSGCIPFPCTSDTRDDNQYAIYIPHHTPTNAELKQYVESKRGIS